MSRKDYILIAAALNAAKPIDRVRNIQWKEDCHAIADALQSDNSRFDRERFLEACGINS